MITGQRRLGGGMPVAVSVEAEHHLADVAKVAAAAADSQGFEGTDQDRVLVVATEMATTVMREAGSGRIWIRLVKSGDLGGVELVATDHGPGKPVADADADADAVGGSDGRTVLADILGLGGMARVGDVFDVYACPGRGTVMRAQLWGAATPVGGEGRFLVGSMMEPIAGAGRLRVAATGMRDAVGVNDDASVPALREAPETTGAEIAAAR